MLLMTTLRDVAKKANVSQMTVSRVFNHPETVSDELKELIGDLSKTEVIDIQKYFLQTIAKKSILL